MKRRVSAAGWRLAAAALLIQVSLASYAASPAPTTAPAALTPRPAAIDRNSVLILIRTTLIALQQANHTGNYSVLYGISAPGFQAVNSPERLSQIFANLRGKGFDLSAVVVLEPQLTVLPEIYPSGVMRMAGFFPSAPMQVYFDLQFVPVQGQWRLLSIAVDVASATATAPPFEPARPKAEKSTETKTDAGKAKSSATPSPHR